MLRHLGAKRNFKHNLRLAILLCFAAGFVNAAGFLGLSNFTTNVTGHTALMAVAFTNGNLQKGLLIASWLLLFLAGGFLSGFYISKVGRNKNHAYTLPIFLEIVILAGISFTDASVYQDALNQDLLIGDLLFSMGMQNALVSVISGSVVRTTHLTGVFTDLAIDLAQLLQFPSPGKTFKTEIRKRIFLRGMIILFFITGCMTGAYGFRYFGYTAFLIPVGVLITTIFYDSFRIRWARWANRRFRISAH